MSKSLPAHPADEQLHPVVAVLLVLALCLFLWGIAAVAFTLTLIIGGSVGLLVLLVGLAGAMWGFR